MDLPADSYWTKGLWRNKAFYGLMRPGMTLFFRLRNHFHFTRYTPKDKTFLLLTNHNSTVDHFLNAIAVKSYIRFVVSDHLMRKGIGSKALKFLVNPIPRRKASSGEPTVKMIKRNLELGIPVIMYAEGNRSFNGRTGFISPRTGQLVKDATGSLITYRIDGAYMQTPRWGHTLRKGPVFGQVVKEYSREELDQMSAEEIYAHIYEDLYCDAYAYQKEHKYLYKGDHRCEYLETTLFVCPKCGRTGGLKSDNNRFTCSCGMEVTMNEMGFFEGADARFETVYDWDMWQRNILMDMTAAAKGTDALITEDSNAILYKVDGDNKSVMAENLKMSLYGDRLEFKNSQTKFNFPMTGLSAMAVAHTSVLFFTCEGTYYEVHNKHVWPANKYFALHRMICGMKYV